MRLSTVVSFALAFFLLFGAQAQNKEFTLEESVLKRFSTFYPETVRGFQWIPGANAYSMPEKEGEKNWLTKVDLKTGASTRLFTLQEFNALNFEKDNTQQSSNGRITWEDANTFRFQLGNGIYRCNLSDRKAKKIVATEQGAGNFDWEAKSNNLAFTIDNGLFLSRSTPQAIEQVAGDGLEGIVYGQAVHRFEFGISKGTFWSPKGQYLAFYRKDETMVTDYPLVNIGDRPASANIIKYPMAGMPSHHVKVGIYDVTNKKVVYIKTTGDKEQYHTNISWSPDEKYVYMAMLNRDQNRLSFNRYLAATGELDKTLFTESDDNYVEPLHPAIFLKNKPNEFLWMSQRDGFMQVFHYNTAGKLLGKLTPGEWDIIDFVGFSADGNTAYWTGTGENPTEQHLFSIALGSKKIKQLTTEAGVHRISLSPDGNYLLDNFSNLTTPRVLRVLDTKGKVVRELVKAANPMDGYQVGTTELMTLEAKDGTSLHARMIKPANFDAGKKYPVLVYVYGGPHAQLVTNSWMGGAPLWMHWMANQGYLVFTVDNRGSDHRGVAFEQAVFRNLGQVEMQDQLTGVEYLRRLPYVDGDRLAVHGWSFGGFMTTSLMLHHPGTFTTGVAGGPVIDWKYYEVMYTERYMDSPESNPEGYAKANLLDKVAQLDGSLFLIHGTVDDVVVWQHSLDFVKCCVDNGVQIDYFVYPGHPHNVVGKDRAHLMRKVLEYILANN